MQDTQINARTCRLGRSGKRHATVGDTSRAYHLGPVGSLNAIFFNSPHRRSWVRGGFELLAMKKDILKVPAKRRADQCYDTRNRQTLELSNQNDLNAFADEAEKSRDELLTLFHDIKDRFGNVNGNHSESSIEYTKYQF